ncbi:MAG: LysR family transcriptional regulator, partial [Hyphomicrobiales bacterium]|nr:LysR family transcriptional regulator [Hyphomicrobiales bacterium]
LVAVVDERHFGKAAKACLVGQSTLSAAIQELEQVLGVQLLERSRRSVVPTPVGRDIAERARQLLNGAEDLVDMAVAAQDPLSGPLRLGLIPTIGPFVLPRIMRPLRDAFPQLKLYLREEQTAPLLSRLSEGEIDAALIALPYAAPNLEAIEVARDRFWAVFPKRHRFSGRVDVLPSDIAQEDLLLLEDGHCLRDHALAACSLEAARRNHMFQGTSLHTLVQMVASGLGVTLLPQVALEAGLLRGLDVECAPMSGEQNYRSLGLVFRPTSGRRETFEQLAQVLRKKLTPQT